ncbi:MAG: response regulator transcription factor [Chloroflexi bacterium]|nr:response regulator transcription factor [Chloroflexota bacterium]MCL5027070.1 response regulator transcription factor [Chloroflexota bacterium]
MKILIVDDDPDLAEALRLGFKLQWPEWQTLVADDGKRALELFAKEHPGIIILDIAMPKMNGFEVLRRVREVSDVPVIMLTVKGEELDKVRALEQGADDYVTKPFGSMELMARVRAVLRRTETPTPDSSKPSFHAGALSIDYSSRRVTVRGKPVKLTPTEYRLLCALAASPNQVLSHQALLVRVWGSEFLGEREFVKIYVKRLRDKIEDDASRPRYILTEWGQGYRLATP